MSNEELSSLEKNSIRFFELINLENMRIAQQQFSEFSSEVVRSIALYEEAPESLDIIWIIKDVISGKSGMFIDWKDTASFVEELENICLTNDIEADIDWGFDAEESDTEYFFENISIPELMEIAYLQLLKQGISLWNWNTDCDMYGLWLTRTEDVAEMRLIAESLAIQARLANQPF